MNIFNLQLRFLIPLVLTLVGATYVALPLMDQLTLRWFSRDLNSRGALVTNALSDSIGETLADVKDTRLDALFDRTVQDERLFAIGLCSLDGVLLRHTSTYPLSLGCRDAQAVAELAGPRLNLPGGPVHVGVHTVSTDAGPVGSLIVLHDLSFVDLRSKDTRRYLIIFISALGLAIALITVVVAQLSWRGWMSGVRGILRGEGRRALFSAPEISPVAAELRARLRDLEDEHRRALGPQTGWDPERLRTLLHTQLRGESRTVHP
jgi:hypothetical protein